MALPPKHPRPRSLYVRNFSAGNLSVRFQKKEFLMAAFALQCGDADTSVRRTRAARSRSSPPQSQWWGRIGVAANEVLDMLGHGCAIDVAAGLDFGGDIQGDVL
jgi:hypothetical protein